MKHSSILSICNKNQPISPTELSEMYLVLLHTMVREDYSGKGDRFSPLVLEDWMIMGS